MLTLHPIPAFNDNYIWCIYSETSREAIVIDPGCGKSALNFLTEHQLNLKAILITHHHPDHIGGLSLLTSRTEAMVYGFSEANFKGVDQSFSEGESFTLLGTEFKVLEVPGHTLDHIVFFSNKDEHHALPWLFSGDTLFSAGCGRLFEGSAAQMHQSLQKLKALPRDTLVCCAHEYTLSNIDFASSLMPTNAELKKYKHMCQEKRQQDTPTLPSSINQELLINPFLREDDPEVIRSLNMTELEPNAVETWTAIRSAKDCF